MVDAGVPGDRQGGCTTIRKTIPSVDVHAGNARRFAWRKLETPKFLSDPTVSWLEFKFNLQKKFARGHLTKRSFCETSVKKKIRQKELSTWYLNVNKVSRFFSELFFSFFFFETFEPIKL